MYLNFSPMALTMEHTNQCLQNYIRGHNYTGDHQYRFLYCPKICDGKRPVHHEFTGGGEDISTLKILGMFSLQNVDFRRQTTVIVKCFRPKQQNVRKKSVF